MKTPSKKEWNGVGDAKQGARSGIGQEMGVEVLMATKGESW
jgi:hypothetical protein